MFLTSVQKLADHFKYDLKIKPDDVVFLFSGIWGLGKLEDGLNTIDMAFGRILETGALIVPTFSIACLIAKVFHAIPHVQKWVPLVILLWAIVIMCALTI